MSKQVLLILVGIGLGSSWLCSSTSIADTDKKSTQSGGKPNDEHLKHVMKVLADIRSGRLPPIKLRLKPIQIEGVVVDAWTYLSGETIVAGSSESDKRNICFAIADDKGKVYVASKGPIPYAGCTDMLAPLLGKRVLVKGFVSERGGNSILKIGEAKQLSN